MFPWASSASEILEGLAVDPARGLSAPDVADRRLKHGRNVLRHIRARSVWTILFAQFNSILVLLLAVAAAAAAAFGEWVESGAIFGVLAVNAALGFFTELKAVRSMEALRKMGATRATVRRDGQVDIIPAADLVPGDILLLDGGDVVTADLRLLEASKLQANESTLTGESIPVEKSIAAVERDAPISARSSMLFKGTVVTRGSGEAVAVATGMGSELGQISKLVEEAQEEETPLERRLNRLGRGLAWVTLVIAGLVAASGYAAGQPLLLIIETAVALAVAAVPEGLPIIATIALARGMYRMVREHALVNRLSAVETLGATSIICTDKTGTLTENRIRVETYRLSDVENAARRALEIGALCNNAALRAEGKEDVGDPLEVALLVHAEENGAPQAELLEAWPELREVAFDPDLKLMATVHATPGEGDALHRVAVKGAPESVLARTTLAEDERSQWQAEADRLADSGLRVLALAERSVDRVDAQVYADLTFVGLVGMHDPPRTGVRDTVEACRRAGVRLVMVTGDHPKTARNIADATGLATDADGEVALGAELENLASLTASDRSRLLATPVFARVSPKQKLDLISLHQSAGAIVAMTGDGVNDAPALRKADIGVAMGQRGTAAAREAADMILLDDDLSTIVVAIREGRTIFGNIRNFVVYLLSCNVSEVMVVAFAAAVGAPLPLLPLQILFLNLLTDAFPALALGVGESPRGVMDKPPRHAKEPVIGRKHWWTIVGYAGLLTSSVLGAFWLALSVLELDVKSAVTVSFLTLAFGQLWHVFNLRRPASGFLRNEITRNIWVWGAIVLCVALLLIATYVPAVARVLSLVPPSADAWALILGMSVSPLVLVQIYKASRGARRTTR